MLEMVLSLAEVAEAAHHILSPRALAHRGCYDCGEVGHWSKECPRPELVIHTLRTCLLPSLGLSDHVMVVERMPIGPESFLVWEHEAVPLIRLIP